MLTPLFGALRPAANVSIRAAGAPSALGPPLPGTVVRHLSRLSLPGACGYSCVSTSVGRCRARRGGRPSLSALSLAGSWGSFSRVMAKPTSRFVAQISTVNALRHGSGGPSTDSSVEGQHQTGHPQAAGTYGCHGNVNPVRWLIERWGKQRLKVSWHAPAVPRCYRPCQRFVQHLPQGVR